MTTEGVQAEMPHFRPARTPNVKVPEIRIPRQQLSRSKNVAAPGRSRMTRAKWLFAVCAVGALAAAPEGARAQFQPPFPLPCAAGAVPPPQQAAPPPGSSEWSGQPGSSGHPLMTTEAILAAAQNFPNCIEGLWPEAAKLGVTRATFDT